MRWPWQRIERPAADAAPAVAARSVPPAGWAFLPPLQRQISDAAPAALRPAFVASLPTRAMPTSLGTMGHHVDDRAPAGTIAVDDGAPGAPVQRTVASELTLRSAGNGASTTTARHVQRVTDAAGHVEPAHASDSTASAPSADLAADSPAPADESWSTDDGPGTEALADDAPETPLGAPELESDNETAAHAEPRAEITGPAASAGPAVVGLVDRGLGVPVSRLPDQSSALGGDSRHKSAGATAAGPVAPIGVARDSASPAAEGFGSPADPPDSVSPSAQPSRPTLQRNAAHDPTTGHDGDPPSAVATPKRIGLGAPLPSRSMQRSAAEGASGAENWDARVAGPSAADGSDVGPTASHVVQRTPDEESGAPSDGVSVQREVATDQEAPPEREAAPGHETPLITAAPLTSTIAADTASETTPAAIGERLGTDALEGTAPFAWRTSRTVHPSLPVVQRDVAADPAATGEQSSIGAASHTDTLWPADASPADGRPADAAPGIAATPVLDRAVDDSTPVASTPTSVPLVAARRIVPAVTLPGIGPGALPHPGGRIVVARVVAPVPPPTAVGGAASRALMSTATGRTRSESATAGAEHDASASMSWGSDGAVGGQTTWSSDEPAVVASVSRLTARPPSTTSVGTARPPSDRMPVAAAVQTIGSAGHRPVDLPTAVQLLRGLPSLGRLPLDVPDVTDVPDVGQLGSRAEEAATEAASDAASRATSGAASRAADTLRETTDVVTKSAQALSPAAPAAPSAAGENVEQLVRKLYGPLVRRIKAELLLDRERRGIRIDGI